MYISKENKNYVIVFGTSPDYVRKLFLRYPERVFFVVDQKFRDDSYLKDVDKDLLLFSDIGNSQRSFQALVQNFEEKNIKPIGLACYDCESLLTASEVARELDLFFPSPNSVRLARNKVISKQLWNKARIPSPRTSVVSDLNETLSFYGELNKEIVLKPVSSSGSELVFHCRSRQEIIESVGIISAQLKTRRFNPLYKRIYNESMDPCTVWVVEEFVPGPEFSCDFILRDGRLSILRTTGKVKDTSQPFGSILAYVIPPELPDGFSYARLESLFKQAVTSLGFNKGFFMVDFIICDGVPYIIEISPRPGGDSIPDLLEISTGVDMLGLLLDFVSGIFKGPDHVPILSKKYVSINLYAPSEGIISDIDESEIQTLPWVKGLFINKKVGDSVIFPPYDYESRRIGYVIAEAETSWNLFKTRQIIEQNLRLYILDQISARGKVPENEFQVSMINRNGPFQDQKTV